MNPNAPFERRWTVGVATAAVIAVLAMPAAVIAQREAPAEERSAFEAATVKLAAPDAPAATLNRMMQTSPNRLYIPNMTLSARIYNAYGDGGFNTSMRVTGGPELDQPDCVCRRRRRVGESDAPATPAHAAAPPRGALWVEDPQREPDRRHSYGRRVGAGGGPKRRDSRSKGQKVDGTCPPVMPVLYLQAPRRPLPRIEDVEPVG